MIGARTQIESFDFFYGIGIAELVLTHGNNLMATVQSSTISAVTGQFVASLTTSTIAKVLRDTCFSPFQDTVQNKAASVHANKPRLHRSHRASEWSKTGDGAANFPLRLEAH